MNFLFKVAVLSLSVFLAGCATATFKRRSAVEMDQNPPQTEGGISRELHKYVFDINVTSDDNKIVPQINVYNAPKQDLPSPSHALIYASTIGRDDQGFHVSARTELWEEPTLKRPRGAVLIKMYMDKKFDDITDELIPDSYRLTAEYLCYKWAQRIKTNDLASLLAEVLKANPDNWEQTRPLYVPIHSFSLWDLKTNQWEGSTALPAKVHFNPYRVGQFLVTPVEIKIKKSDFESNCVNSN